MKYKKDIFHLPKGFPFNLFITNATIEECPELHFHDCLEINYILKGSGYNYIENKQYLLSQGDLYVINCLERHKAVSDGSLEMLVIIFDPVFIWRNDSFNFDYLKPFFDRSVGFSNCISKNTVYFENLQNSWLRYKMNMKQKKRAILW